MTDKKDSEDKVCKACGAGFDSAEELEEAIEEKKDSEDEETSEDSSDEYGKRVNLKVYDIPVDVKNKYISLAKLDYDNKLWKVLEAGLEKLEEDRNSRVDELEQKTDELQKQIVFLKTKLESLDEDAQKNRSEGGPPSTFGDQRENGQDDGLDSISSLTK